MKIVKKDYTVGVMLDKAAKVVNSCTTLKQTDMAIKYCARINKLVLDKVEGYNIRMTYKTILYNVVRDKYNTLLEEKNKTTLAHIQPPSDTDIEIEREIIADYMKHSKVIYEFCNKSFTL